MIKLVAYTSQVLSGEVFITDSEGDSIHSTSIIKLLNFINEPYADKSESIYEIKVTWDLNQFVAPILKLLGKKACRELAANYSYKGLSSEYEEIAYIPDKLFLVKGKEHKSFFCHLKQFFSDDEPEPEDASEVASMGDLLREELQKIKIRPLSLISPINIYENEVLRHFEIPTILDLPIEDSEELIDYAEACTGRLWIEAYQVGHWNADEVYHYDIQSAFPYHASQLYSIKHTETTKSDRIIPAHWGFLKGQVTIYKGTRVSPIIYTEEDGSLSTPTGTWEDTLTLDEVNFIYKHKLGSFKVKDGWFVKFKAPVKPLEIPLQKLFNYRAKSEYIKKIVKDMAVGVYGKFIELHEDGTVGKYYNPLWGAMISTKARLQVADFIYRNKMQSSLVHVSVDGILSTKDIEIKDTLGMGKWKKQGNRSALSISSGKIFYNDRHHQGLTYGKAMEQIEENPKENVYKISVTKRQTLKESVERNEFSKLGEEVDSSYTLDLNLTKLDQSRTFMTYPSTGRALLTRKYKSEPKRVTS